jgi:3-hydroxyisobutyrate dehydrogenase
MRIGFVGLGNMGGPMAMNLIRAGHRLVVNDIDPAATARHREQGAVWADTPADVARASEVVFTSLPGPAQIEQVALGADSLIEGLAPGAIYADLSTGSPSVIRRVAERIEAAGAHVIDAPVSGGVPGAEAGTLAVMVGGDRAVFEQLLPLFEVIGAGISYVGDIGSGTVAKLVHNMVSMTTRMAVQEGLALAVKGGVEPGTMLDVLKNAAFGKQILLTHHIPAKMFKGVYDPAEFSLALSHKDSTLAIGLAEELGVPVTVAGAAHENQIEAMERGWADFDCCVTFRLAEERAGVTVRG